METEILKNMRQLIKEVSLQITTMLQRHKIPKKKLQSVFFLIIPQAMGFHICKKAYYLTYGDTVFCSLDSDSSSFLPSI